jgi:hypothetical protein
MLSDWGKPLMRGVEDVWCSGSELRGRGSEVTKLPQGAEDTQRSRLRLKVPAIGVQR